MSVSIQYVVAPFQIANAKYKKRSGRFFCEASRKRSNQPGKTKKNSGLQVQAKVKQAEAKSAKYSGLLIFQSVIEPK